ncbi:MAG: hypothetical protein ABMB14_13840 [Myxococcota bacterium]
MRIHPVPKSDRRARRIVAALNAGAALATTLAVMALASPKLPPMAGE